MLRSHQMFTRALPAFAVMFALTACSDAPLTSPQSRVGVRSIASAPLSAAVLPTDNWFPVVGEVRVCNFFAPGSYTASATAGNLLASSFTISTSDTCVVVWQASAGMAGTATVTVTETPDAGSQPSRIAVLTTNADVVNYYAPVNSASVVVSSTNGASFWFKNDSTVTPPPPPPPPPGFNGCTPGYWKQTQHFDSWTSPYTPTMQFSAVFANAFPGKTLLQVLSTGGGGLDALGRHTVAALLSTANGGVNYPITTAQVISAFNAAYASGNYEAQKNIFAAYNEANCPLN